MNITIIKINNKILFIGATPTGLVLLKRIMLQTGNPYGVVLIKRIKLQTGNPYGVGVNKTNRATNRQPLRGWCY